SLGGLNAGFENTNQLIALAEHEGELDIAAQPVLAVNEPRPPQDLTEFLEAYLHLKVQGFRFLIHSRVSSAALACALCRDDPGPGPRRYPRLARHSADGCRTTGWPAESSRPPGGGARSSLRGSG